MDLQQGTLLASLLAVLVLLLFVAAACLSRLVNSRRMARERIRGFEVNLTPGERPESQEEREHDHG
jgi:hypothetical protein